MVVVVVVGAEVDELVDAARRSLAPVVGPLTASAELQAARARPTTRTTTIRTTTVRTTTVRTATVRTATRRRSTLEVRAIMGPPYRLPDQCQHRQVRRDQPVKPGTTGASGTTGVVSTAVNIAFV